MRKLSPNFRMLLFGLLSIVLAGCASFQDGEQRSSEDAFRDGLTKYSSELRDDGDGRGRVTWSDRGRQIEKNLGY